MGWAIDIFKKNKEPKKNGSMMWLCTSRNRKNQPSCTATVRRIGDVFTPGSAPHTHEPNHLLDLPVPISKQVKDMTMIDRFASGMRLAENVSVAALIANPGTEMPSVTNLARCANRKRAALRPPNLLDLFFKMDNEFIPSDVLKFDIRVGIKRHLVFATKEQLNMLQRAPLRWYVDGTFKVVKDPFYRLTSNQQEIQQKRLSHRNEIH